MVVWYGMAWFDDGMVWWYGVVWFGDVMVWRCTVWYGMLWYNGMVVWYGLVMVKSHMILCSTRLTESSSIK